MGTPKSELVKPDEPKVKKGLTAEEISRMEAEMETIENDFRAVEQSYGENVLNLTVTKTFLKKLIENPKVTKFLSTRYTDLLQEFQSIAAMETL